MHNNHRFVYTPGHSRLVSAGVYLPEERVASREIMERFESLHRFNIPSNWLERVMGIHERRKTPEGVLPSDMAAKAAEEALERADLQPAAIDCLIYAGVDRDYLLEPATAHIVQHKLGAYNALAFDVSNACHGFMNGMHLVDTLIATGQVRCGLVVTGEQGHRYVDKAIHALLSTDDRAAFAKLAGGLTLGDAGAALIMGSKRHPDAGFMGFMLQSQGQYSSLCTCGDRDGESPLQTDMASIIQHGARLLGAMYREMMKKLNWRPEQIVRFVAHQVGLKGFLYHARYAGVSTSIMPNTVRDFGNLVTANIPVNLHKLICSSEMHGGDKVFIAGAGSGLAIGQAGLVWDAA
jgi:acyl-CoA:acyl-CoA alkyltransferase